MKQIEFVDYTDTQTASNVYETIAELKSVKIDPASISGIDYHKQESRKAKFEFYCSDWVKTNLVDSFNFISNTEFSQKALRYLEDGVVKYIGFVKADSVDYNQKTGMIKLQTSDIMGLFLVLADTDKDYTVDQYQIAPLLESEVTDVLSDLELSYTDETDYISYDITDSPINFDNQGAFEDIAGYDGLLDDPPINTQQARIRSVKWDSNNEWFKLKIADFDAERAGASSPWLEKLKYAYFNISTKFIIFNYDYRVDIELDGSGITLWNEYIDSDYGTDESIDVAYSATGDKEMRWENTDLFYSGPTMIDYLPLNFGDEAELTINRKKLIKAMELLLNGAMKISDIGDITIIEKNKVNDAEAIDVDGYVLENKRGFILHSKSDFENDLNMLGNARNMSNALTTYYNDLFDSFKFKYEMDILSDVNLELNDTINDGTNTMKIAKIKEEINKNKYKIIAWGE